MEQRRAILAILSEEFGVDHSSVFQQARKLTQLVDQVRVGERKRVSGFATLTSLRLAIFNLAIV